MAHQDMNAPQLPIEQFKDLNKLNPDSLFNEVGNKAIEDILFELAEIRMTKKLDETEIVDNDLDCIDALKEDQATGTWQEIPGQPTFNEYFNEQNLALLQMEDEALLLQAKRMMGSHFANITDMKSVVGRQNLLQHAKYSIHSRKMDMAKYLSASELVIGILKRKEARTIYFLKHRIRLYHEFQKMDKAKAYQLKVRLMSIIKYNQDVDEMLLEQAKINEFILREFEALRIRRYECVTLQENYVNGMDRLTRYVALDNVFNAKSLTPEFLGVDDSSLLKEIMSELGLSGDDPKAVEKAKILMAKVKPDTDEIVKRFDVLKHYLMAGEVELAGSDRMRAVVEKSFMANEGAIKLQQVEGDDEPSVVFEGLSLVSDENEQDRNQVVSLDPSRFWALVLADIKLEKLPGGQSIEEFRRENQLLDDAMVEKIQEVIGEYIVKDKSGNDISLNEYWRRSKAGEVGYENFRYLELLKDLASAEPKIAGEPNDFQKLFTPFEPMKFFEDPSESEVSTWAKFLNSIDEVRLKKIQAKSGKEEGAAVLYQKLVTLFDENFKEELIEAIKNEKRAQAGMALDPSHAENPIKCIEAHLATLPDEKRDKVTSQLSEGEIKLVAKCAEQVWTRSQDIFSVYLGQKDYREPRYDSLVALGIAGAVMSLSGEHKIASDQDPKAYRSLMETEYMDLFVSENIILETSARLEIATDESEKAYLQSKLKSEMEHFDELLSAIAPEKAQQEKIDDLADPNDKFFVLKKRYELNMRMFRNLSEKGKLVALEIHKGGSELKRDLQTKQDKLHENADRLETVIQDDCCKPANESALQRYQLRVEEREKSGHRLTADELKQRREGAQVKAEQVRQLRF